MLYRTGMSDCQSARTVVSIMYQLRIALKIGLKPWLGSKLTACACSESYGGLSHSQQVKSFVLWNIPCPSFGKSAQPIDQNELLSLEHFITFYGKVKHKQ